MKKQLIGNAFQSIRNGANIKQDKFSGGIPITRIESISNHKLDLNKLGYAGITGDDYKEYFLEEGDILMSHINSVSHLGKVAIYEKNDTPIIHGMNLLCLKANEDLIYPKYAYYYFRTSTFKQSIKKITKKSVNQASFNITNFKTLEILVPNSLKEQIYIAELLSKADELIQQRINSIELLDEFLKSVFWNTFGDLLTIDKGWNKIVLGQYLNIKHGFAFKSDFFRSKGEYVLLTPGNFFEEGGYRDREEKQKYFVGNIPNDYLLSKNNLLIAMTEQAAGLLGSAIIVPESNRFLHNQRLGLVQYNQEKFNLHFLFHLFNSRRIRKIIHSKATGTKVRHTSPKKIESIEIFLPPLELQNNFSSLVYKFESLKTYYQNSLTELRNLFDSLSQKAFKGELNLINIDSNITNIIPVRNKEKSKSIEEISSKQHTEIIEIDLNKSSSTKIQESKIKLTWEDISTQQIANWIIDKYKGYHFSSEMVINFLEGEHGTIPHYFSSEELKTNPKLNESDDLKSFLFSAIEEEDSNPFLKLEQLFYDGEEENFQLNVREEDYEILKQRTKKERSGIYFKIIE